MRESPAIPIARMLVATRRAVVGLRSDRPRDGARGHAPGSRIRGTLEAAVAEVDAALLVTRWD